MSREKTGKEHAGSGFVLDGDRVGEELEQGAQAGVLEVGVDGPGNAHRREGEKIAAFFALNALRDFGGRKRGVEKKTPHERTEFNGIALM